MTPQTDIVETQGYKIIASYRYQCTQCHYIGDPTQTQSEAAAQGELHALSCIPADPFMVNESGISLQEEEIAKRQVRQDIPGFGLLKWILAGKVHVTFVNKQLNERFTYKVTQASRRANDPEDSISPHFVSVLTGSNNTDDYQFAGTIFHNTDGDKYIHSKRSSLTSEAPSVVAFQYVYMTIYAGALPDFIEVWHEGRCCICTY